MVGVSISSVPLPKGLWCVIEIDYKASEAEILVNVAACLLSQNEPHSLDLLSIAARPRDADDLLKAPLKCKSSKTYDLPSWVPALGSWTVSALLIYSSRSIYYRFSYLHPQGLD